MVDRIDSSLLAELRSRLLDSNTVILFSEQRIVFIFIFVFELLLLLLLLVFIFQT
jgi:hypothetical protein